MFGCQITEIRSQHFSHRQECDDHLKPDEMLDNTDSNSFMTSNQDHKITDPAASARPEKFQNSKSRTDLFIITTKLRKPSRHNAVTMVNEPCRHNADDGQTA